MRPLVLYLLWLLTDALLFLQVYALAYFLRVGWLFSSDYSFTKHMIAAAVAVPVFLSSLIATRSFGLTRNQRSLKNIVYIAYSSLLATATFALAYYFLYQDLFSRLLLIQVCGISFAALTCWHFIYERLHRAALRQPPAVYRALIVGVTRESKQLISELLSQQHPIVPVAVLDARGASEKDIHGVPVLGKLNKLEEVMKNEKITHLIQCADLEQSLNLLSACRQQECSYLLLPSVLGMVEGDERIETLAGHPVTIVNPGAKRWMWFFR